MKLIDKTTRKEIKVGDTVTTFRGEKAELVSFNERRVHVKFLSGEANGVYGWGREYFPSVINAEVVEEYGGVSPGW